MKYREVFCWKTQKLVQIVQIVQNLGNINVETTGGSSCGECEMLMWFKSPATPPPTPPEGQGARKTTKNRELSWSFCWKNAKKSANCAKYIVKTRHCLVSQDFRNHNTISGKKFFKEGQGNPAPTLKKRKKKLKIVKYREVFAEKHEKENCRDVARNVFFLFTCDEQ